MRILIVNGANLNLLGKREPEIYGSKSFESVLKDLRKSYPDHDFSYFQSNIEGEIVDALQKSELDFDAVVLNPGGYAHTSVVIADAVKAIGIPVIEVHISNIFKREEFRYRSVTASGTAGCITGFGLKGYMMAVHAFINFEIDLTS